MGRGGGGGGGAGESDEETRSRGAVGSWRTERDGKGKRTVASYHCTNAVLFQSI